MNTLVGTEADGFVMNAGTAKGSNPVISFGYTYDSYAYPTAAPFQCEHECTHPLVVRSTNKALVS